MYFVTITGPRNDIDRIVDKYLSKYEIQLEYAPSELKTVNTLYPYVEQNPYREQISHIDELADIIGRPDNVISDMDILDAVQVISDLYGYVQAGNEMVNSLKKEEERLKFKLDKVLPFKSLNYNIGDILNFKSIRFRFGRIPHEYYRKFIAYVDEDLESIFIKATEDEHYVWGVYFVSIIDEDGVDAAYSSLHFERTFIPEDINGTPHEEVERLSGPIKEFQESAEHEKQKLKEKLIENKDRFFEAYIAIKDYIANFEIRKYAACTRDEGVAYYILCGWMTEDDAKVFSEEMANNEPDTICIVDEEYNITDSSPPTKLKNPRFFKPFEMFIRMYGTPAYNEIDPTIFVALTYTFIFGVMFGDVGQGLFLMIGGFALYKIKKMDLAAIISCAGFFSTIFGFMFGSVFGYEDIIKPIWLSPSHKMTELPMLGSLNTVFVIAVAFGMVVILIAQVMHIINALKAKDTENKWFDANGLAGLVFYGSVVGVLVLFMLGKPLPAGILLIAMFGIPLILIALKEPLTHLVKKKAAKIEGGIGMFAVQTFFEMFEVLLSYFSNTVSFVRIGAFAVSHAAMMQVVMMLAGAENGGAGNILVVVFGNIFVVALEGLIVGIQVLRLEYYEIFSRFYKGTGREFKPF